MAHGRSRIFYREDILKAFTLQMKVAIPIQALSLIPQIMTRTDLVLLGPLLIQTSQTVLPTGLGCTTQHPHISLTILDARFWFLNWSSEIHVMGIIRICNLDMLDIFHGMVTTVFHPGEPVGTLCP